MDKMKYFCTKSFGHNLGFSACFRQWRAKHSHCQYLHGYALAVKFVLAASELDSRNWVFDFGDFKEVKQFLTDLLDHKTLVAKDDPQLEYLSYMERLGLAQIVIMDNVGCEAFSEYIGEWFKHWLFKKTAGTVRLMSCEVREHEGNSAVYMPEYPQE